MEWSFSVRSYFHLTGWVNDVVLTRAETRREPILLEEVPVPKRSSIDMMYHFLASLCRGRAQVYVRVVPRGNGLEIGGGLVDASTTMTLTAASTSTRRSWVLHLAPTLRWWKTS